MRSLVLLLAILPPVEAPRPKQFFSIHDQTTIYNTRWGWKKGSVTDSRGVIWFLHPERGYYSSTTMFPEKL